MSQAVTVQPMGMADIATVIDLEQAAYGDRVPQRDYERELNQNKLAHYYVIRPHNSKQIVGSGGFWLLADEAHLMTIAVHPAWQGAGLGQWLLLQLLLRAHHAPATLMTLEVRPSNRAAVALYRKYQFEQVGLRPHYYADEEALIMNSPLLHAAAYQNWLQAQRAALTPRFTAGVLPRNLGGAG